ncbi:MAG: SpoIIE family protein phosphatase [Anaerolineae bacterium]
MDYRDAFAKYVDSQELSPQEAADAWDAILAFEGWLAGMGQPVVLSRTAVLKYRAELVARDFDRDALRRRVAPIQRFVSWLDRVGQAESEARVVRELNTLKEIATTLNQTADLQDAIDAILRALTSLMGLSTGWVFLLNDEDAFIPVADIGLPPALGEDDRRELRREPECECQWQLRTGRLKRAVNIVQCSRLEEAEGDTGGLRYHASIPIRARKRTLGILNVTGSSEEVFSGADLQVLGAVGDALGMAIERARLIDYARSRRFREQETLLRLSRELLSSLDPRQVTQLVVEEAARILDADAAAVSLLSGDDSMIIVATVGWQQEWLEAGDFRALPGGLTHRAYVEGDTIIEADMLASPSGGSDIVRAHGWRAGVAAPVAIRGDVIGVLAVYANTADHFSDEDSRLLGLIAAQAALAIHNAREYEEKAQEAWHRNALLQVSENIRNLSRMEDILETVGRLAPMFLGAGSCGFFLWDGAAAAFMPHAIEGGADEAARRARFATLPAPQSGGIFDRVLADRQPFLVMRDEAAECASLFDVFDADRLLVVPLVARSLLVGVMILDPSAETERYTPRLLEIASGMGSQTAVAIENERLRRAELEAERLAQELELAHHIQRSFLPEQAPTLAGWDIAPRWEPARIVTGDFYDFVTQPDGGLGVVIADVSDKGAPAAIFMAVSRSLLRASIMAYPRPIDAIDHANALIAADADSSMFVTAFLLALDGDSGHLDFVNAGHNPPLLVRADGSVEWLGRDAHGPALGIVLEYRWPQRSAAMAPGDTLVLYTDGVTEAINDRDEAFGEDRLVEVVASQRDLSAEALATRIVDAVGEFAAGHPQFDDITLVVLKRLGD